MPVLPNIALVSNVIRVKDPWGFGLSVVVRREGAPACEKEFSEAVSDAQRRSFESHNMQRAVIKRLEEAKGKPLDASEKLLAKLLKDEQFRSDFEAATAANHKININDTEKCAIATVVSWEWSDDAGMGRPMTGKGAVDAKQVVRGIFAPLGRKHVDVDDEVGQQFVPNFRTTDGEFLASGDDLMKTLNEFTLEWSKRNTKREMKLMEKHFPRAKEEEDSESQEPAAESEEAEAPEIPPLDAEAFQVELRDLRDAVQAEFDAKLTELGIERSPYAKKPFRFALASFIIDTARAHELANKEATGFLLRH